MKKSSWMVLGICVALSACLGFAYVLTRPGPEALTREMAVEMLSKMQEAVKRKSVNGIMEFVAPASDIKLANLKPNQLRMLLANAFRNSGKLTARCTNIAYENEREQARLAFDLLVRQETANMISDDYNARITLYLKRVDVPRLFGLFSGKEWRIVGAESTGKDPSSFGNLTDF